MSTFGESLTTNNDQLWLHQERGDRICVCDDGNGTDDNRRSGSNDGSRRFGPLPAIIDVGLEFARVEFERDQALEDVLNVEKSFSELHKRYERAKSTIEGLKHNEALLQEKLKERERQLAKLKEEDENEGAELEGLICSNYEKKAQQNIHAENGRRRFSSENQNLTIHNHQRKTKTLGQANNPIVALQGLSIVFFFMVFVTLANSCFRKVPLYSMTRTEKYNVQRTTGEHAVPYFVKETFLVDLQKNLHTNLTSVESWVEEKFALNLQKQCSKQKQYKESLILRATKLSDTRLLNAAKDMTLPSCDGERKLGQKRSRITIPSVSKNLVGYLYKM